MPICKSCPIIKECNKHPILVKVAAPTHYSKPQGYENQKKEERKLYTRQTEIITRLCPLVVLLGNMQTNVEKKQ